MKCGNRFIALCAAAVVLGWTAHAQVQEHWAVMFNGSANNADNAYAMDVDRAGFIVVAGDSRTGASTSDSTDYVVVKFTPAGDTLWARTYNGPANKRDVARSVAVDASGNVYVTGESYGTTDYDIATVKYSAAGVFQWASRYNGPANGADGASSVAVDASGNVYVTGYSDGDASSVFRQDDFVTIKYNAAGALQWAKRYNGPGAFHDIGRSVAVDVSGNVYVTGESTGSGTRYDYATIRYNPSGDSLWVRRYNGPANYNDKPTVLRLDGQGGVYVTGSSDGSSSSNQDYATIKYDSLGVQQWLSRYDGPGGGDDAFAMVCDIGNSVYVTGESRGPAPTYSYDYLTLRLSAQTGDTLWSARYDGDGLGFDAPVSIAADARGSVFVTGYSTGPSSQLDVATLGYDSLGARRWVRRYSSSGAFNDQGVAVALDTSGTIYVAGSAYGGAELNNIILFKFTDLGGAVGVEHTLAEAPTEFSLSDNYPNPFNPETTIEFVLPQPLQVTLEVYDMLGKKIETLVEGTLVQGRYRCVWNAGNVASGMYMVRLHAGEYSAVKKLLLLK